MYQSWNVVNGIVSGKKKKKIISCFISLGGTFLESIVMNIKDLEKFFSSFVLG